MALLLDRFVPPLPAHGDAVGFHIGQRRIYDMRLQTAWDRVWGGLGLVRQNRRRRKAAAARRRSMHRRHRFDALEQRVVLNADPIAQDDYYTMYVPYGASLEYYDVSSIVPDTSNDTASEGGGTVVEVSNENPGAVYAYPGDTVSYQYTITDGNEGYAVGYVYINFVEESEPEPEPEPEGPTAHDDVYEIYVEEGSGGVYFNWSDYQPVTDNDYDPQSGGLSIVSNENPGISQWGYVGQEYSYSYVVEDVGQQQSTANVIVRIIEQTSEPPNDPPNNPPSANDDYYSIALPPGSTGEWLDLSWYGPDVSNDYGDWQYVLSGNSFGTEWVMPGEMLSFSYTLEDFYGAQSTAYVYLSFYEEQEPEPNNAPWAYDGWISIDVDHHSGEVLFDQVPGDLFGDNDAGDMLSLDWTPLAVMPGQSASGVFTVTDSHGATASATLHVSVNILPNDDPVLGDDELTVPEDGSVTGNLAANDWDAESDVLTYSLLDQAEHGVAVVDPSGTVTYTPAADFFGTDSFTYQVDDGFGGVVSAIVYVTVTPVADPVVAVDDVIATAVDAPKHFTQAQLTANDVDPDAEPLSVAAVIGHPQHGSLTWNPDGSFTYTPVPGFVGVDSFCYDVTDGTTTSRAKVWIEVGALVSTAAGSSTLSTLEDAALELTFTRDRVDGVAVTHYRVTANHGGIAPVGGTAQSQLVVAADADFVYHPAANFNGPVELIVEAGTWTSGSGFTALAAPKSVAINVAPVNDAPTFDMETELTVLADEPFVVVDAWATDIAAGPADEAGQELTFEVVLGAPEEAALFAVLPKIEADGTLWFVPSGVPGTAHLAVTLHDDGGTASGGVAISASRQFTITFADPAGGGSGGGSQDDLLPVVQFAPESGNVQVREDIVGGNLVLTVVLSKASTEEVSVVWYAAADTALPGVQYHNAAGTLVFAAGQTTATIEVPLIDDSQNRGMSKFKVTLDSPNGATLGNSYDANVDVIDDDVTVTISDASVEEGPAGENGLPQLVFVVELSGASDHEITVDYSTVGVTAGSDDFEAASGTLTFAPGEMSKEIRINVKNNGGNTLDPDNSNFRRGESAEQLLVVLTSSDPRAMISHPVGVGTITDDDWEEYQVVDDTELSYIQIWYDGTSYQAGDIIDLDPNAADMNGGTSFVVPENWFGANFYQSYLGTHEEWLPIAPPEEAQPIVSVELVDGDELYLEGNLSKARFRIVAHGIEQGQTITVQYALQGLTAVAGEDFDATPGQVTITGDGNVDVASDVIEVPILADSLTELAENFMLYVSGLSGAMFTPSLYALAAIGQPRIKSVGFTEAGGDYAGTLDHKNRFFPDAQVIRDEQTGEITGVENHGRNLVRVRAEVENLEEGDRIYFRAYDVDDPSKVDPTDKNGNDNFGRLNPATPHVPGEPQENGGYAGLLRGIDADGNGLGEWKVQGTSESLVYGIVRRVNGVLIAEAEMLVSFQPGDNFRVLAIPQPLSGNPAGGDVPSMQDLFDDVLIRDKNNPAIERTFGNSIGAEQPTNTAGAKGTAVLTVWRKLHIELDQMSTAADLSGDDVSANYIGGQSDSPLTVELEMSADVAMLERISLNSHEGGILKYFDGTTTRYVTIVSNTAAVGSTFKVVVAKSDLAVPLASLTMSNVTLYDDDIMFDSASGTLQRRIDVSSPETLAAATKYLQSSANPDVNRLADGFVEPEYVSLVDFNSELPFANHADSTWLQGLAAHYASAALESNLFWISYVAIAYQSERGADNDGDAVVGGQLSTPIGSTIGAETLPGSLPNSAEMSVLYAETTFDSFVESQRRQALGDRVAGHAFQTAERSREQSLGIAVAQQVLSQLYVAAPEDPAVAAGRRNDFANLMHDDLNLVALADAYLNATDLRYLRQNRRAGRARPTT